MNEESEVVVDEPVQEPENRWLRALFALLFVIFFGVLSYIIYILVVVQTIIFLVRGEANERLQRAGIILRNYACQILDYLTCNTNERPFPFMAWPDSQATPGAPPARPDNIAEPTEEPRD